jgi:hypothetical protein
LSFERKDIVLNVPELDGGQVRMESKAGREVQEVRPRQGSELGALSFSETVRWRKDAVGQCASKRSLRLLDEP